MPSKANAAAPHPLCRSAQRRAGAGRSAVMLINSFSFGRHGSSMPFAIAPRARAALQRAVFIANTRFSASARGCHACLAEDLSQNDALVAEAVRLPATRGEDEPGPHDGRVRVHHSCELGGEVCVNRKPWARYERQLRLRRC